MNLSVTKWFYDLGWSGISIEPNSSLFKRLSAARSRDINLECGAGASRKRAQFMERLQSSPPRLNQQIERSGCKCRRLTVKNHLDIINRLNEVLKVLEAYRQAGLSRLIGILFWSEVQHTVRASIPANGIDGPGFILC